MSKQGKSRRKVLSAVGLAIGGLGATTTASASNNYQYFDPYDFDSVSEFGRKFNSLEDWQKEWIIDQLSDLELEAYADSIKPGLVNTRMFDEANMSDSGTHGKSENRSSDKMIATETVKKHPKVEAILKKWGWKDSLTPKTGVRSLEVSAPETTKRVSTASEVDWTRQFSTSIKEKTITGLSTLYKWEHHMRMGIKDDQITDYYTDHDFSNLEMNVSFDSFVKDKQKIFSGDIFTSDKKAKFVQKVPYVGIKNYEGYPQIKWEGTWDGDSPNTDVVTKRITESNFF